MLFNPENPEIPVFSWPLGPLWPIPHVYVMPERRITRDDVTNSYVHPPPEVAGRPMTEADPWPAGARSLLARAKAEGFAVVATYARGTTLPTWRVNAPDSRPNPGPAVESGQYHGDVEDSVRLVGHQRGRGGFVAYWVGGKTGGVSVHAPSDLLRPCGITHLMRKLAGNGILSIHPDE